MAILRVYIGETATRYIATLPPEKQKKSNVKNTAFFVTFGVINLSVAVGTGVCSATTWLQYTVCVRAGRCLVRLTV